MKNNQKTVTVGSVTFSNLSSLSLIAGPCALEGREHAIEMASALKELCQKIDIEFVYKTSFDKANRTSINSERGVGLDDALPIFAEIKATVKVPILTDVHSPEQCAQVASVVDILQIPAFLCRQTDLLIAAAKTNCVINVKKGQFLAPWDMKNVLAKIVSSGNSNVLLTERGASFGYNTLVSDMRSIPIMAEEPVHRLFLMQLIQYNNQVDWVMLLVDNANMFRFFPAPQLQLELLVCSLKLIKIQIKLSLMVQI